MSCPKHVNSAVEFIFSSPPPSVLTLDRRTKVGAARGRRLSLQRVCMLSEAWQVRFSIRSVFYTDPCAVTTAGSFSALISVFRERSVTCFLALDLGIRWWRTFFSLRCPINSHFICVFALWLQHIIVADASFGREKQPGSPCEYFISLIPTIQFIRESAYARAASAW